MGWGDIRKHHALHVNIYGRRKIFRNRAQFFERGGFCVQKRRKGRISRWNIECMEIEKVGGIEVFCSVRKSGRKNLWIPDPVILTAPISTGVHSLSRMFGVTSELRRQAEGKNERGIERKRDAKGNFFSMRRQGRRGNKRCGIPSWIFPFHIVLFARRFGTSVKLSYWQKEFYETS